MIIAVQTIATLQPSIAALAMRATENYQLKIPSVEYSPQGDPVWKDTGKTGPPNVVLNDIGASLAGSPNASIVPVILVQLTEVSDGSFNPTANESIATAEINIVTFSDSPDYQGREDIINLLTTLRTSILETQIIGGHALRPPLHCVPQGTAFPLYFGTIFMHYSVITPKQKLNTQELMGDPMLYRIVTGETMTIPTPPPLETENPFAIDQIIEGTGSVKILP
jgi:hypothetical protein